LPKLITQAIQHSVCSDYNDILFWEYITDAFRNRAHNVNMGVHIQIPKYCTILMIWAVNNMHSNLNDKQWWHTQEFFCLFGGGVHQLQFSSVQRAERIGSGGGSPLVRGPTIFANEWNLYSN
jgi:hypothetical protein